ncbi:serine aminopeptidase domain-containing protein [Cupriavidus agavae]|uniref:Dienelactone hydrolase family protein n=1 Tax=Cupriavidus agavae TaxID=1001822 RepID=A0A4Q7RF86_9BURK|nr:alpha/beta hydrolase [Cupriavidus agavae]RZT31841.1 dienelactone hydrolase family protein [Cupriavidus agavae]
MKRIMFDGCAGWLHEAAGAEGGAKTGVVLCAPQLHEAMWAHRGLRHLADDLAAAGVPVLRFDYYGTGDSAGEGGEPDFVPRAVQNIVSAAGQLRALAGVQRLVLCGWRLGATLAVLAAETMAARDNGPAALVLMAPVINGRGYLRELRALTAFYDPAQAPGAPASAPAAAPDAGMDVLSYRLAAEAMHEIGALRLDRRPGCPAPNVLLLDDAPGSMSAVAALGRQYEQAGVQVDVRDFFDSRLMMKSPEISAVPEAAWRGVVQWLAPDASPAAEPPQPATVTLAGTHDVDGVIEHSVWIDGGRQFGVLCEPAGQGDPPRAVVIFPNTGGSHHVGDGRAFVLLSRALARRGFAALRLDVSTLGDSPGAAREMAVPRAYAPRPREDVSAAVDWARARGHTHIVMAGVCSGAYLSFQAALTNPSVTGVVMANALKFLWRDADDAAEHSGETTLRDYLFAARNARNWQRLMRGDIPVGRIAAKVGQRLARLFAPRPAPGVAEVDPEPDHARDAMARLSRRGVQLDLLYGVDDAGLALAGRCFGDGWQALHDLPGVSAHRCAQLDHAMILAPSRETFLAFLMQNLRRQQTLAEPAAGAEAAPATGGAVGAVGAMAAAGGGV